MAKKASAMPEVGQPTLTPQQALTHFREVKKRLDAAVAKGSVSAEDKDALVYALERALAAGLGENHPDIWKITRAGEPRMVIIDDGEVYEDEEAEKRATALSMKANLLGELIKHLESTIAVAPPPAAAGAAKAAPLPKVIHLLQGFHRVARQLRARHNNRGTLELEDEYDVQDLLHALLRLDFEDIRPEEWTPSYAGKPGRMDFLLKAEQLVIEVKMTRKGLGVKEVGDELIVDIARYQGHQDCKTLVCFVYDPLGLIGNPASLERDLSQSHGALTVKVVVFPKA